MVRKILFRTDCFFIWQVGLILREMAHNAAAAEPLFKGRGRWSESHSDYLQTGCKLLYPFAPLSFKQKKLSLTLVQSLHCTWDAGEEEWDDDLTPACQHMVWTGGWYLGIFPVRHSQSDRCVTLIAVNWRPASSHHQWYFVYIDTAYVTLSHAMLHLHLNIHALLYNVG